MKNKWISKIILVVAIVVIVYMIFQIILPSGNSYKVKQAVVYQYDYSVQLDGFAVKDEKLIEQENKSVIEYLYADSEKVKKNTVVARVYETEQDLINNMLIEDMMEQLEVLTYLNTNKTQNATNVNIALKTQLSNIMYNISTENFSSVYNDNIDFLKTMSAQELILNPDISYDKIIQNIQDEIIRLQDKISGDISNIKTDNAGYFTNHIDGYENIITTEFLDDITLNSFDEIKSNKKEKNEKAVGKIVESAEWNFVAKIKTEDLQPFKQGYVYYLKFDSLSYKVPVVVSKIVNNEGDEYGLIVLNCDTINEDVINLRYEKPHLCLKDGISTGLKIDRDSIRIKEKADDTEAIPLEDDKDLFNTEQKGVYVNEQDVVKFKKIDIVYSTDTYVITSIVDDKDYVKLYDQIITSGKDLYDDKSL